MSRPPICTAQAREIASVFLINSGNPIFSGFTESRPVYAAALDARIANAIGWIKLISIHDIEHLNKI
jgi:hypothetical protein